MDNHPVSQEEFKDAFERAFNENDSDGMERLIYAKDMPDVMIDEFVDYFTAYSGVHWIESLEFSPYEPDPRSSGMFNGRQVMLNLTPEYWFDVATVGNDGYRGGESSFDLHFPVGVHDGRYFFCGQVWADE